jgi:DNA polymerase-3 subunit beta
MNFIVSTSAILKKIQSISGAIATNTVLPIVECYLFELNNALLTLSSTDLETSMSTDIQVDSTTKGKVAIPAKQLTEILKNCSEQPLSFMVDNETFNVEITTDNGKYKLMGENGDNYPKIPKSIEGNELEIASKTLHRAFGKTFFATGTDEIRPAMTGVYVLINADGMTVVSTDAHRLVKVLRTDVTAAVPFSCIIPRKAVGILKGILNSSEDKVKMATDKNNAYFDNHNIRLACRLIDAKYPDYEAVIPRENPNVLSIATHDLNGSLKRVNIFTNKTTNLVALKLAGSNLHVKGEDIDYSEEGDEVINCNYNGEDMEIGFNAKFFIEMLNELDSQNLLLEMSIPSRAGIIKPEIQLEHEELMMLIMPMMLAGGYN